MRQRRQRKNPSKSLSKFPRSSRFLGENGHNAPTNYAILCKDTQGRTHRYETHKVVLVKGSGFFCDLFETCDIGKGGFESDIETSSPNDEVEELELMEADYVVMPLLLCMYNSDANLKQRLQRGVWESHEFYSM